VRDVEHGAHVVQYMHQQCNHLGILCNNVDIKASVSLSLLVAMLLAYAYSPAANLITLAGAVAFTMVVPMRVGIQMLGRRTVAFGVTIKLTGQGVLSMPPDDQKRHYVKLIDSLGDAITYNDGLLRHKLHQNWSLMVISMPVFGYVMAMTAAGAFIEFPEWSTRPFR